MEPVSAVDAQQAPGFEPAAQTAAPTTAKLYEQALTLSAMGFHREGLTLLRDVVRRAPGHAPVWKEYSRLLRLAGQDEEARVAATRATTETVAWEPAIDTRTLAEIDAGEQRLRGRMHDLAEPPKQLKALQEQLRANETDIAAMRLLGRLEWQSGNLTTARALFERGLVLAPQYEGIRDDLAGLLLILGEHARALAEAANLIGLAPGNASYRALRGETLLRVGNVRAAIPILEGMVREDPENVRTRCVYAQSLHFVGRREDSVREYRKCLELQPGTGEAYWGLAELRGDVFTPDDIAVLRRLRDDPDIGLSSRMLVQYALGRILERAGDYAHSFAAFEAGAALSRTIAADDGTGYNPAKDADQVRRHRSVFSANFIRDRAPALNKAEVVPIFVVGMPRAGSTLVEQILASHSAVEGTIELPVLGNIVRDLSNSRLLVAPDAYPECLRDLSDSELAELGTRYLEESAAYRRVGSRNFVDKRPWSWLEAGLIRLILPHAKIVDVRREPMASCFAMYKQMLANSATFSNDLEDLAHYYIQYATMMEHWERVIPGHIHLLSYERLVEDTETEIRRLLDYCDLPFEDSCLRFWETDRAIPTPSAEQVRRPIFRHAVEHWRKFEPWLGPLREGLNKAKAEVAAASQPPGYDYALTLAAMSMHGPAIEELRAVTQREPDHASAWRKLSELLRVAGEDEEADEAAAGADRCENKPSRWQETRDTRTSGELLTAASRFDREFGPMGDDDTKMNVLQEHLLKSPTDAAATYLLSELEQRNGDEVTALALLERTVELAPRYHEARAALCRFLGARSFWVRALEEAAELVRQAPLNPDYRALWSNALNSVGETSVALGVTERLVREYPRHPGVWHSYGQQLQALGNHDESARAFRTCLELAPKMGVAYSGLANLKTGQLTAEDTAAIRVQLADPALESEHRMHMYYALGHVLEAAGDYGASFKAYEQGARLFRGHNLRLGEGYSEDAHLERLARLKRVYTARNLTSHTERIAISLAGNPIFIVGLPRAGSSLVEQILGSHSLVEATRELPIVDDITRELSFSRRMIEPDVYPDCVLDMSAAKLAVLGERYLREARFYRKSERPWFTDKRPWNWMEAGLIHLILPYARIIDIRREPMAACFGMFKQILPASADFSNDLRDTGRYYIEYVAMMEHLAREMPGRIHFMQYERLVDDTENEIRRMLDYCGLPFEENCLRFWENKRSIPTPSAEQVRRPIYRDALEQWRNFEPWLGPLKAALSEPPRA